MPCWGITTFSCSPAETAGDTGRTASFSTGLEVGLKKFPSKKAAIKVVDMHINDAEFAQTAVDELHGLIQKG